MDKTEKIINSVCANMRMENMLLTCEEKEKIKKCLEGKYSYDDEVVKLVDKYTCV